MLNAKTTKQFQTNSKVLNLSMITFFVEAITYAVACYVGLIEQEESHSIKVKCRYNIAFDAFSWVIQVNWLLRTCITSYMNI